MYVQTDVRMHMCMCAYEGVCSDGSGGLAWAYLYVSIYAVSIMFSMLIRVCNHVPLVDSCNPCAITACCYMKLWINTDKASAL